jgi:hypothetical protein
VPRWIFWAGTLKLYLAKKNILNVVVCTAHGSRERNSSPHQRQRYHIWMDVSKRRKCGVRVKWCDGLRKVQQGS